MKYHKLVENAKKPNGFWGKMMIKAMNKGHSSLTSWGLEHMNIERTATVLDIGCGGGKTVDRLCSMVANGKVYGIDFCTGIILYFSKVDAEIIGNDF